VLGNQGWGGDLGEEHVAHCYGDGCPFEDIYGPDFQQIAEAVWFPLFAAEGTA
jgi:hypothetical protein